MKNLIESKSLEPRMSAEFAKNIVEQYALKHWRGYRIMESIAPDLFGIGMNDLMWGDGHRWYRIRTVGKLLEYAIDHGNDPEEVKGFLQKYPGLPLDTLRVHMRNFQRTQ